jgi:hypothetical protein
VNITYDFYGEWLGSFSNVRWSRTPNLTAPHPQTAQNDRQKGVRICTTHPADLGILF